MFKAVKDWKELIWDGQWTWVKKHKVAYAIMLAIPIALIAAGCVIEKVRYNKIVEEFNRVVKMNLGHIV